MTPEAYGRFELSGGAVTNTDSRGLIVLGAGRGRGEFIQTGGDWYADITRDRAFAIIGAQSGVGLYALSNGTARIRNRMWVGGATTNDLQRTFKEDRSSLTDAQGQLTVAAADRTKPCALAVEGPMVFGALGTGVLDMGPGGTLTGTDLTLSNRTASVFRSRVTEAGAGLVSLSGRFTVTPGAELDIDATALPRTAKGRFPLVRYASREGAFDQARVTIRYDGACQTELRYTAAGMDFVVMRGTALIFR